MGVYCLSNLTMVSKSLIQCLETLVQQFSKNTSVKLKRPLKSFKSPKCSFLSSKLIISN